IIDEPPVRIYVMGADQWRDENEWPLARTQYTKYYLHSAGRANSLNGDGTISTTSPLKEPVDRFVYDPANPVLTNGSFVLNPATPVPTTGRNRARRPPLAGPSDQRPLERRDDVLVYTTGPLKRDLEVTGPVSIELYAATDATDTDFTGKLLDVWPNGYAQIL